MVEGFPHDTLVAGALAALGEKRRVVLRKRIPVAGGLGGGSSDAAAVLRALRGDRDPNELHAIARTLGADVPFFLTGAEAAFGTGRGDRIQPLPDFPRGHAFVLVPSDRGLATAEVFAACEPNPIFRAVEGDLVRAMHTVRSVRDVATLMANDLEPVVLSLRPDVAGALADLRSQGALAQIVTRLGPHGVWALRAPPGGRGGGGQDTGGAGGLSGMIPGMSKWNISGDALTIEPRERRSPTRWLSQNGLRIAVVLGLAEAVVAWADGFRVEMTLIGVVAVLVYLNIRHRLPQVVRRPLWVVVMAQGIAGLVLPLIYVGVFMFALVGGLLLIVLVLVMLGDRMRK